ncbi:MAG TPA: hypothetical protein VGX72_05540 [Solirubrobacteraceae bacterium]|nr:hypothetical protein [Solirubrobacteraceae bacterium]
MDSARASDVARRIRGRPRRSSSFFAAAAVALGAFGLAPRQATAANFLTSFSAGVLVDENTANPQPSDYATQAGSHPDVAYTKFTLDTSQGSAEFVRVDLPAGLTVNPQAIPRCSASGTTLGSCASDTRVGTATVTIANVPIFGKQTVSGAVYNMTAPAGAPADFAFEVTVGALFTVRTDLVGGVRDYASNGQPGDFGEYFTISSISNLLGTALEKSELVFWGAPEEHNGGGAPNNAFLTNPTSCGGPQTTYIYASTYSPVVSGRSSYTTPVGTSGCEHVPFSPTVSVTPSTMQRDKPDGITVDVGVAQNQNPAGIASSHLENASITLPPGMSLDPSAANGLQACTEAQFAAGTNSAVACPVSSVVGSVEISTPVLAAPLTGSLYVGAPEEGNLYRVFLDAENTASGVIVRLIGSVTANAATGQLTATFTGSPQVPFTALKLAFKTGPGALFANPLSCGAATTTSSLVPYSGNAAATPTSAFTVDNDGSGGGCSSPLPFAPTANAALSSTKAASSGDLTIALARSDGEQLLDTLDTQLPEGLLANLNGITLCSEPYAAHGTCPAASQIGTVTVAAGAGTTPLTLSGSVYLTGPYEGQPFGLSIAVPAIAGPYNLGTVVARAAVAVNTVNGQIDITTDPLPTIVEGIPLRLRSVVVAIDKAGFLVNPTDCSPTAILGALTSIAGRSQPFSDAVQMTGCESLSFSPTLTVTPTSTERDAPTGETLDLKMSSNSSALHSAVAELPPGLTLNPAVADGLQACTDAELAIGFAGPVACPGASAIGSVEIDTPLLPTPLTGSLYVGQPLSGEPASGQEYRLFLDAENAEYDLSVRLIGLLAADPASGRLTATFPSTPSVPFSELRLVLDGGAHAPLANPQECGPARFTSTLVPVSGSPAGPSSEYTVDNDGRGGACPSSLPFSPGQSAVAQPATAGANAAFTLSFSRRDGQQYISQLHTTLPPGLLGRISSATQCPEAQANVGACPSASQIGTVLAGVGAGASPLELPGAVYLTGPYAGAPFGLAIAVPAEAVGPFDFGTVLARAKIEIDEHNARVTITSGALPTIVGGAPLRLQTLTVSISSAFMVNPTSCAATDVESQLTSTAGAVKSASTPFQPAACGALPFAPSLSASTSAKFSKLDGASLLVNLAYPAEHQANLASVSSTLPTQLATRLSALQNACPEAAFAANPASCATASHIGEAAVATPLLPGELTGPAYLVSNAGAAFPDLNLVLTGDGVRLMLHGQTNIKAGQITATFPAIPDVPLTHFTLSLPMGPNSALAANGALCGETLLMPSVLTAQNGARVTRQVGIEVTGCPPGTAAASASLSHLKLSPSRFAAAASGASIAGAPSGKHGRRNRKQPGAAVSYDDTRAATTTFVVLRPVSGERRGKRCLARASHARRRHGACTRYARVGSFTHSDRAGVNRFYFTGRIARHRLPAGSYRLEVTASYPGGGHSKVVSIGFAIVHG